MKERVCRVQYLNPRRHGVRPGHLFAGATEISSAAYIALQGGELTFVLRGCLLTDLSIHWIWPTLAVYLQMICSKALHT